jgi:hypothetical protein
MDIYNETKQYTSTMIGYEFQQEIVEINGKYYYKNTLFLKENNEIIDQYFNEVPSYENTTVNYRD